MIRRFSLCAAALLAVVVFVQPALAVEWKLFGSSGNSGSFCDPEDILCEDFLSDDENLYAIDTLTGDSVYVRGLRNNVDAELAAAGWTAPFWGKAYRDGQSIAFNPNDGLLYHRNGSTGYRDGLTDPRHYDTRLIETYDPGASASFTADPVKVFNALTDTIGGPFGRVSPDHPFDGTIWSEARSFSWNPIDEYFILADNDGDIGHWDPTSGAATDAAVHVATNAITHRGISWYTTNLDGTGAQRLFSGVNDESPGNIFYELDSDSASGTYLEPLALPATINLIGGPVGAEVDQTQGMAQNPATGDLYSVITLSIGERHLIRYNQADVDAFNALTDTSIDAQYLGPTGVDLTAITFVPYVPPPCDLPGDSNEDCWVDGLDYLIWAENFGTHPGVGTGPGNGDYNDDGWVDGLDYLVWATNFGTHDTTAVPEPASSMLLILGLVACGGRRRAG